MEALAQHLHQDLGCKHNQKILYPNSKVGGVMFLYTLIGFILVKSPICVAGGPLSDSPGIYLHSMYKNLSLTVSLGNGWGSGP